MEAVAVIRVVAIARNLRIVAAMSTVAEIEAAIVKLPVAEQRELARWLEERLLQEESPEMLMALDEGIRSLEEKGVREYSRGELENKVRQWTGGSR